MFTVNPFSRYKLLFLTILVEGIAFGVAIIMAGICNIELFPLTRNLFRDLLIGASGALLPLSLLPVLLSDKVDNIPLLGSLRRTIINDIKVMFSKTALHDLVFISLCAGFTEELLFRGAVQPAVGIAGASVIFGLFHFVTPAYCIIATIMGFYLGCLYQYYDSLLIPMQLHFVYDLGALIYLRYFCFMRKQE